MGGKKKQPAGCYPTTPNGGPPGDALDGTTSHNNPPVLALGPHLAGITEHTQPEHQTLPLLGVPFQGAKSLREGQPNPHNPNTSPGGEREGSNRGVLPVPNREPAQPFSIDWKKNGIRGRRNYNYQRTYRVKVPEVVTRTFSSAVYQKSSYSLYQKSS